MQNLVNAALVIAVICLIINQAITINRVTELAFQLRQLQQKQKPTIGPIASGLFDYYKELAEQGKIQGFKPSDFDFSDLGNDNEAP